MQLLPYLRFVPGMASPESFSAAPSVQVRSQPPLAPLAPRNEGFATKSAEMSPARRAARGLHNTRIS
jgi:hypothetical protein